MKKQWIKNTIKQNQTKVFKEANFESEIKCNHCIFTFVTERDLRMHEKKPHELLLSCNQSQTKTKTKEEIKIPKQETHYRNINCEQCDFKAKDMANIKLHIFRKHLKMELECEKKFSNRGVLALNKKKHIPAF